MTNLLLRYAFDFTFGDIYIKFYNAVLIAIFNLLKVSRPFIDKRRYFTYRYKVLFFMFRRTLYGNPKYLAEARKLVREIDKVEYDGAYVEKVSLRRSMLLKNPRLSGGGTVEKGVLLMSFFDTFEYYIKRIDVAKLLERYYIVLEPSWTGFFDYRILFYTTFGPGKVIVEASDPLDYGFIGSLDSNLVPVKLCTSDWVDDRIFYPIEGVEKVYDVVYVASFGRYKRHQTLFKAIRDLKDPSIRVALVGAPWKSSREEIENLIDAFGVRDNVVVYEDIPPEKVNEVLNMSRVNVLLSLREGGNKGTSEGLFAGVPAIVLKNHTGYPKEYINEKTGMLIDEKELGRAINHFREHWREYDPSGWARENISCRRSTDKLNRLLKEIALAAGEEWTSDIAVKVKNPEINYYDEEDRGKFVKISELLANYRRAS